MNRRNKRRSKRGSKRRLPFAAYAALIFNAALCVSPFIAARAISDAYGDKRPAFEATSEAIAATRDAMNYRFQVLARNGGSQPREAWANMIRNELEAGEMTTVNGLLQAAPAMLSGQDGEAIKARLAVSDQSGEAALISAAVAYLPEDVQDTYERRSGSILSMFSAVAPASSVAGASKPETAELVSAKDEDNASTFNVLGNLAELSITAARWARNDKIDEFAFVLSGVGLILADAEAREGASIAMSARRTQLARSPGATSAKERKGALDTDFEAYLKRKLYLAAPPEKIRKLLEGEFQSEYGYRETGPAVVQNVFKSTVDKEALKSILDDLRIMRDIARDTSPTSAVQILSQVKDGADLRRAKLVAQAGGDMAVPLARFDGEHLLDTARVAITWSNALKLQIAGLLACLALLGFLSLTTFWKSVTRDKKRKVSAIYQMEETARP